MERFIRNETHFPKNTMFKLSGLHPALYNHLPKLSLELCNNEHLSSSSTFIPTANVHYRFSCLIIARGHILMYFLTFISIAYTTVQYETITW